ncbi:MAG: transposase family protein [Chloroflexota bacterium]
MQRELRRSRQEAGLKRPSHPTRPNRTSSYQSVEQERQARSEAVIEQARLIRAQLPTLLARLSQIPDPRNPLTIKHTLTTLMLYGILMFVLQTGSRRKTNEKLSAPAMKSALMELFPDLESIPHHDTLYRLLARIEPQGIEAAQLALVNALIRDKKFSDYLIEHHYLIAMDGTQKLVRRLLPDEPWLQRKVGAEGSKRTQYYVYVLEANLMLANGISIPLMSEFLDYHKGDSEREKQDCEQRAFFRLAERLKAAFPRLPIMLLLDGLFATGPVMRCCRDYGWHFMIVLQDGSLPYVWQEYYGLKGYRTKEERLSQMWADRQQSFEWQNEIEYRYGQNERNRLTVHLVHCQENWQEMDPEGSVVQCSGSWAWLSDITFAKETVHARCNLGGRHRWGIEEGILVEKQEGYHYEHLYAEQWNAMRGYHYLMRIGHLLNVLACFLNTLIGFIKEKGPQGFIGWVRETLSGRWLQPAEFRARLCAPFQLRLIFPLPAPPGVPP